MKTICVEADVPPTGILVAQMPEKLEIVSIPRGYEITKKREAYGRLQRDSDEAIRETR
jgi:hypothetical protein